MTTPLNLRIGVYDIETSNLLYEVNHVPEQLGFVCGVIVDFGTSQTALYRDPAIMIKHLIENFDIILGFNNKEFDNRVLGGLNHKYLNPDKFLREEITFGKHKGTKWDMIPDDYLKWMVRDNTSCAKVAATILRNKTKSITYTEMSDYTVDILNKHSIDLFEILKQYTGMKYPCSLNDCCKLTINEEKTKDMSGAGMPILFKQGAWDDIDRYQVHDGDITKSLFEFVFKYQYCLIPAIKGYESYSNICIKVPIDIQTIVRNIIGG